MDFDTVIFLAFLNLSPTEIIAITLIILLLFGAKRLPELAKGVGKSLKEFKKATSEVEGEIRNAMESPVDNPVAKTPENTQSSSEHTSHSQKNL